MTITSLQSLIFQGKSTGSELAFIRVLRLRETSEVFGLLRKPSYFFGNLRKWSCRVHKKSHAYISKKVGRYKMCKCQGNPSTRVTLPACKQGLTLRSRQTVVILGNNCWIPHHLKLYPWKSWPHRYAVISHECFKNKKYIYVILVWCWLHGHTVVKTSTPLGVC